MLKLFIDTKALNKILYVYKINVYLNPTDLRY